MFMDDRHMSDSLDRWITGNYGEDQFGAPNRCRNCGKSEEDANLDGTCSECGSDDWVSGEEYAEEAALDARLDSLDE
jgi:predicted Zn-ribbon and HTH transcriptional regulator